jgi:hypothetical protein
VQVQLDVAQLDVESFGHVESDQICEPESGDARLGTVDASGINFFLCF